jgi:hypothetical protein
MQIARCKDVILKSFISCAAIILAGCAQVPGYTVSPRNVVNIREARNNISLGEFTGGGSSVSCRDQFIFADFNGKEAEKDKAYALYIRKAFEQELASAGVKPGLPSSKISLKLLNVDTHCGMFQGAYWTLEAEVTIEGKAPFVVKSQRDFKFSMSGKQIVEDAAKAFPASVQAFIAAVVAHPTFRAAVYQ